MNKGHNSSIKDDRKVPFLWTTVEAIKRVRKHSPAVDRVYMHLILRAGHNGNCWQSIESMSQELYLSEGVVKRSLTILCKEGLIKRVSRTGTTSLYSIQDPEHWEPEDSLPRTKKSGGGSKTTQVKFDPGVDQKRPRGGSKTTQVGGSNLTHELDPMDLDPFEQDPKKYNSRANAIFNGESEPFFLGQDQAKDSEPFFLGQESESTIAKLQAQIAELQAQISGQVESLIQNEAAKLEKSSTVNGLAFEANQEALKSEDLESDLKSSADREIKSSAAAPQNFSAAAKNAAAAAENAPKTAERGGWDVNTLNAIWNANKAQNWKRSALMLLTKDQLHGLEQFLTPAEGDRAKAYELIGACVAQMAKDAFYSTKPIRIESAIGFDPCKPCKTYLGNFLGDALDAQKPKPVAPSKPSIPFIPAIKLQFLNA